MQLEGVALSVVAPTQELLYSRLAGIQARHTQSKARRTLEAAVRHIQADNTLASATYPVRTSVATSEMSVLTLHQLLVDRFMISTMICVSCTCRE